jgi:hypothetical protein
MQNETRGKAGAILIIVLLTMCRSLVAQDAGATAPPPVGEDKKIPLPSNMISPVKKVETETVADEPEVENDDEANRPKELAPLPAIAPQPNGADEFLPSSFAPTRYSAVWTNSPFEREILPPVKEIEEEVNELDAYSVVGIGKLRGGKYLVTILHPKDGYKTIDEKPSEDKIYVVSVSDGRDPKLAKVKIKRGDMDAEIEFDSKSLSVAPKTGTGAPAGKPGGRSNTNTALPQQRLTPQQQAAAENAKRNSQALIQNLKQSTQNNATATPTPTPTPAAPASQGGTAEPKRRRVVLPPTR